jgi:2-dehydropantoate 2-reductase
MGAGSVGCYLGGRLALAGIDVHFVGRPRMLQALRANGLTVAEPGGTVGTVQPGRLSLHEAPVAGLGTALVLLCVKSGATAAAAAELAAVLPAGMPVLSMQNGLRNAEIAQAAAPGLRLLAGMVPYNVAQVAPGHFLRGSDGRLVLQDDAVLRQWIPVLRAAGLPAATRADMRAVQWAKLLLNLNNPVNALSGLPLRAQLLRRDQRLQTAALMSEALELLALAGQPLAQVTALPPRWLPRVLGLPTPLFRLVAARMLRMDPRARSSMADDLALGRATEVRALCGEVVRLAQRLGREAPLNAAMIERIESAQRIDDAPAPGRVRSSSRSGSSGTSR